MKKFRFSLSVVLETRKAREKEALRVFAQAQSHLQGEIQNKTRLLSELDDAFRRRAHLGDQPTSVSVFQTEHDFILGIKQKIIQADQAILKAQRKLQKASRDYLHARKESLAMEHLRDRAYAEFRQELKKKEQRELDDLTVMRAGWRGEGR